VTAILGSIPSPPSNGIKIGPLQVHAYGLMIALGVVAAARWSSRWRVWSLLSRGREASELEF